jgi:hypothetical protein
MPFPPLSRPDRELLQTVLGDAFPTASALDLMTGLYLGLPLERISAAPGRDAALGSVVSWAESHGRIPELIEAAREADPCNPRLQDLAGRLSAAAPDRRLHMAPLQDSVTTAEFTTGDEIRRREEVRTKARPPAPAETEVLQRIAVRSVQFFNTEEWRNTMEARERAVCRIEFPEGVGQGTGFLVGADLVMTNAHVLDPVIAGRGGGPLVRCRFGYQVSAGNSHPEPGFAYGLAREWLVASSPVDDLDYAIVRLARRVPSGIDVAVREPLEPVRHAFETGEAIFIIQHPRTAPLKVASGGLV